MSYHLTILRSSQGKQLPIALEEAVSAAQRIEGWSYSEAPPTLEYSCGQGTCTLWYQDGELWTKNPEEWGIDAMLVLAERLGARVRGDEWETYESDRTFLHPDDIPLGAEAEAKSKAAIARDLGRQRLIRNAIVGFFIAVGFLAYVAGKWFENH